MKTINKFLAALLLGDDPRLRPRLRLILLVASVHAMSLLGQWHAVANGMADFQSVRWLVLFIVVGVCSFYLLMRSGATRHPAGPSLALP